MGLLGFSEDDVTKEAEDLGITRERYVKDLLQALTIGDDGREGGNKAVYSFQLAPDHCQLSYQKICNDVTVHLGSVDLQAAPDPLELNQEIISQSIKRNTHLESKNKKLMEENHRLKKEHQHILVDLQQLVDNKETLEQDLYTRFVKILNEKKAKIRGLQERLHQLQQTVQQRDVETRQSDGDSTDVEEDDGSQDQGEVATPSVHPSQEPTIYITGRNLECHGVPVDRTFSDSEEEEQPKRKRRLQKS
ncbi:DNA repair protein XRCC4 isoform X2 [Cynoglossus semilaevis]|uniref:DNA repair protein XRCC4 isoform X2 n=1 Tax=Cynoglossus semilaevis TaxID=244447 RepID=UPI000D630BB9|nr:DNA repair protein XRCC4 isoform X2 [Cynoglossus semilaevis]